MDVDKRIREDVEAELDFEPSFDAASIGVAVKDHIVTLTGTVPSWGQRYSAERAALRVRGVSAVADELEVRLDGSHSIPDAELAETITRVLKSNYMVPKDKVQAVVSKGTVTLKGDVAWNFERNAAENAVRELRGVRSVVNQITVSPAVKPMDVETKIRSAFKRAADIDADHVHAKADHGHVTLTGHVSSWAEKRAATRAAWAAAGVNKVTNNLRVESGAPVSF